MSNIGPYAVTGGNSFVGSHLVKKLLSKGCVVHVTVRDTTNPSKTQFLLDLPNANTHLKLFDAELLKEGSFKNAFASCVGVFHCAAPWLVQAKYEEHWNPIVEGTKNVLKTVVETRTVKRVVVVSSCAAVYCVCSKFLNKDKHVYSEESWNSLEAAEHDEECQKKRTAEKSYFESKTAAEKEAWRIVKEANDKDPKRQLTMVSVNPSFAEALFRAMTFPEAHGMGKLLLFPKYLRILQNYILHIFQRKPKTIRLLPMHFR